MTFPVTNQELLLFNGLMYLKDNFFTFDGPVEEEATHYYTYGRKHVLLLCHVLKTEGYLDFDFDFSHSKLGNRFIINQKGLEFRNRILDLIGREGTGL